MKFLISKIFSILFAEILTKSLIATVTVRKKYYCHELSPRTLSTKISMAYMNLTKAPLLLILLVL